ncbi:MULTISPECIES: MFS transporter [Bacillus]|uniref:MFS transporter n=1 Tax=Bacillus TaxID=1386 RepID=UPI0002E04C97|nr:MULTISPECIES: MFS transporter [Bacillus]
MKKQLESARDLPRRKNKWLILLAVGLFTFMSTLDGSIVNIAIPTMSKELSVDMNQVEWIVSIYLMIICIFILLFGKLGDTIGKVKVFRLGTFIFIFGSFLCGISYSLTALVLSRMVQALGASMTMATNYGIITEQFPVQERGKALGLMGSFVSLGSIAGPGIGGVIIGHFSWEYIFLINVPIGLITILLGFFILPKDQVYVENRKVDYLGFVLFGAFIFFLFGAIFVGQEIGFMKPLIKILFVCSIITFILLIIVEKRVQQPLINIQIFANRGFSLGLICAVLVFTTSFFYNVLMPFYLQKTLALTASSSGFLLMILPLVMVIVAPISGYLSDKVSSEILTFIGLIILTCAQLFFVFIDQTTHLGFFVLSAALMGAGVSLFQSPNNAIIMSSVQKHQLGIAGSMNSLARNVGMVIGVALATTSLYSAMSYKAGYGIKTYIEHRPDLFIFGFHFAFIFAFFICLLATVLTGYRILKRKQIVQKS